MSTKTIATEKKINFIFMTFKLIIIESNKIPLFLYND